MENFNMATIALFGLLVISGPVLALALFTLIVDAIEGINR
jgi:hypothetical protein